MPAAERRKGKKAELDVVNYIKSKGWDARTSRAVSGMQKGYDIVTELPLCIEVKNQVKMELSAWLTQAKESCEPNLYPIVWHKKKGEGSPGSWYVTMDGETLMSIMEAHRGVR